MCVGFWSLDHPDYALMLCTNRDEFLSRPTENAHFHSFRQEMENDSRQGSVLSGLDIIAGGTWLGVGVNRARLALLTNITEQPTKFSSSRGHLVSAFLLSDSSHPFEDEVGKITPKDAQYAGFNLLLLAPSSQDAAHLSFDSLFVSNGGAGGTITSRPLSDDEKHCGGMSNGIDGKGASEWPKVKHGIQSLDTLLRGISSETPEANLVESLFQVLTWRSTEPPRERSHLRNTIQVEPYRSPGTAVDKFYGTRLSTVILIRRDGRVLFIERDIWKLDAAGNILQAEPSSERVFRFQLPLQPTR